jgi:poly(A) polymerase
MGERYDALDDLDFATSASPEQTLAILKKNRFSTYDVGIDFGTVGTTLRGKESEGFPKDVQITTYRSAEVYRRGSRHPVVSFGSSIDEDLWRRDFSINSIAMDADGNFVDPYDGRGDIERRVLRTVGDPRERLAEDPLRILRIGRFYAKLGFAPHPDLVEAASHKASWLLDIARQRWLQEMSKLVCGRHAPEGLEFLREVNALGVILPELVALADFSEAHDADFWQRSLARTLHAGNDKIVSWAALFADVGRPWTAQGDVRFHNHAAMASLLFKGVGRRLHFDNATLEAVAFVLQHQDRALSYASAWTDVDLRRFARQLGELWPTVIALAAVFQAEDPSLVEGDLNELRARLLALDDAGQLVPVLPRGLGGVLMKGLELRAGPIVGEVIEWLTEEIIAGRLASCLASQAYLDYLVQTRPPILARTPRFGRS